MIPTQIRQLIGAASIIWGIAILAGQGLPWINNLVNGSINNMLYILILGFLGSFSGIIGGWMLLQKQLKGYWLVIPFCLYQSVSSYFRYEHYSQHASGESAQLALLSAALGIALIFLAIPAIITRKKTAS